MAGVPEPQENASTELQTENACKESPCLSWPCQLSAARRVTCPPPPCCSVGPVTNLESCL
eukprot:6120908-Lingulodinium_polyedra.AAC.1